MLQSRTLAGLLSAVGAAIAALALLAPVASAGTTNPGYEQFKGCPTPAEKTMEFCLTSEVYGGHLQSGKKTVPIENPLTLSGGLDEEFENFTAGPEGGLSKTPEKVPGGVVGLTGLTWLLEFFSIEALTLYATTELAGQPTGITVGSVTLPIKVHLTTPSGVLGNNCYIASNSNPIVLHNITGTTKPPAPNKPITGQFPKLHEDVSKGIFYAEEGTFVDNSFAVPGASGCVLKVLGLIPINLDGTVNFQAGLPSAAGTNESVQEFNIELSLQETVY
jgi:hypothetical protein